MRTLFLLSLILIIVSSLAKTPNFNENSFIIKLNQLNFDNETNGFSDKSWVLLFYAPWCPHCNDIQQVYEELSEKLKGKLTFAHIDWQNNNFVETFQSRIYYLNKNEQNIQLKDRFGVSSFPTIILVSHETKKVHRFKGQRTTEGLEEFLTKTYKESIGTDIPIKPSIFTTLQNYLTPTKISISIAVLLLLAYLVYPQNNKQNTKQKSENQKQQQKETKQSTNDNKDKTKDKKQNESQKPNDKKNQ